MDSKKLIEVAAVFSKLGVTAFGGPVAHIAMMEEEIVRKRKWVSPEYFIDLIGITNLIPGPNSTEMTMHLGKERAGIAGLFVAGLCFIFPAAVITFIFALLYVKYGKLPEVAPFLFGIKPAILSIIFIAIFNLGRKSLKNWPLGIISGLAFLASFIGISEIYALLGSGVIAVLWFGFKDFTKTKSFQIINPLMIFCSSIAVFPTSYCKLFFIFLKIGATIYGSGYVLIAYFQAELIDNNGWLTQEQLLDAVAIGQFTPGPLFTTATFIGFQIGGTSGAFLATLGIFLPSFVFVLLVNPLVKTFRASKVMGYFLDGVNVGAIAVMLSVSLDLGVSILVNWQAIVIALIGLFTIVIFPKLNMTWIIIGGAIMGYLLTQRVF